MRRWRWRRRLLWVLPASAALSALAFLGILLVAAVGETLAFVFRPTNLPHPRTWELRVRTAGGGIALLVKHTTGPDSRQLSKGGIMFERHPGGGSAYPKPSHFDPSLSNRRVLPGFDAARSLVVERTAYGSRGVVRRTVVVAPLPFLLLLTAVPPGLWVRRYLSDRAVRKQGLQGRCLGCGYDLRATEARCPECGERVHRAAIIPPEELPDADPDRPRDRRPARPVPRDLTLTPFGELIERKAAEKHRRQRQPQPPADDPA